MKGTFVLLAVLLLLALLVTCASDGTGDEISKSRAIEIARLHVTFEPGGVEAVKDVEGSRPVWRITFRGKSVSTVHPGRS